MWCTCGVILQRQEVQDCVLLSHKQVLNRWERVS